MQEFRIDERKRVAFPHFHYYNIPIRYMMEQGFNVQYLTLPDATRETVELGTKYSPDYACAPFKHTLGSLIEAVNAGADILLEVGGLCRLDYFGGLQEKILQDMGYQIEFIDLAVYMQGQKGWMDLVKRINPKAKKTQLVNSLYAALKMVEYMDEAELYYHRYAYSEAEPGSFKRVYTKFLRAMRAAESYAEIKAGYLEVMHEMEALPRREISDPIRIGVVGDYFTALDEHANLNLEEKLIAQGCSVERFLNVTNCNIKGDEKKLRPKVKDYVTYNMGANSTWTINAAYSYAERGFDGLVQAKSFGCTPETDCVPVLQNISRDYHMPVLYLSYDTQTSDTGLDTRIEAFCDMLERKKKVLR